MNASDSASVERGARSERREPDGTTSEVAPGIFRLMLPIQLPGLGHVNCYVIPDSQGVALIDPGLADGVSHTQLVDALATLGADLGRVHTVITTHSHFDHFGGVAQLRRAGAEPEVVAHREFGRGWHEIFGPMVSDEDSGSLVERSDEEVDALARRLVRPAPWGGTSDPFPGEVLRDLADGIDVVDVLRPPTPTGVVEDGSTISLGDRPWEVIHTPGHADDHICLWNSELGVLFSGDHLLPTITPHISGFSRFENPLQEFFTSLKRVGELERASIVLPAHGDPFTDLEGRAEAIAQHHVGRLDRVAEIGAEIGDQNVEAYMRVLFQERSWGSMAASETYAHLEWLVSRGRAQRSEVSDTLRYRT